MYVLLLDLLQYSRLSSVELELVSVDIEAAVRDVIASIEQEVQDRKARINVRSPLRSVVGHPATVRQVLYNLISNSLKFVLPNHTPQIEIWSEPQNSSIRVWVSDDGIGIAPQHHAIIFVLFQLLH